MSDLDDAVVTDRLPDGWTFLERFSDGTENDGVVEFGTVAAVDVEGDVYTFGRALADPVDADEYENDAAELAGEERVVDVGTNA